MNIADHNFRKHGHTSFDVWLEKKESPQFSLICAAIKDGNDIIVGLLDKRLWKQIEWNANKAALLRDGSYFTRICGVRIIKSGWFAFATVEFLMPNEIIIQGKTDKAFSEFLVSISNQII